MLYTRLNTANMLENERKNIVRLVREFQRREEESYIYLSLDDFGKIEKELVFQTSKYNKLVVDVYSYPSGQVQEGGVVGTANFNILLSKLPREDNFYKEGALDVT